MSFNDDKYLDVCQNIEAGLKVEYEREGRLTDEMCSYALERAKAAVKHPDGHFKFPHLWPLKLPQAGRGGLWVSGPCLTRLFWTPSSMAVWQAKRVRP